MRTLVIATVATLGFAAAALAQSAAAPPVLPKLFASYSQPDITPGLCRTVSPNQTDCIIPAMSAGVYLIEAAGTSTATSAEARQQLTLIAGSRICGEYVTQPNPAKPWATGARTFRANCQITVVTDKPLTVSVRYADLNATKDPKGPLVKVSRLPWDGVVTSQGYLPKQ
jgi:hypothetical protein